jgi:methyl-accepting chemotaxis protein
MKPFGTLKNRLARARMSVKLTVSFLTVIGLCALLGATALLALSRLQDAADDLATRWLPVVGHAATIRATLIEIRDLELKHTRAPDASYMSEYEDRIVEARARIQTVLDRQAQLPQGEEEKKLLVAFRKNLDAYAGTMDRVLALSRGGKQDDAREISDGAAKIAVDESLASIDQLSELAFVRGKAASENAHAVYRSAKTGMTVLLATALTIGLVFAVAITRNLILQLGGEPLHAAEVARAVASGDLTTPIKLEAHDRSSLMAALKEMQMSLSLLVASVRQTAELVSTASAEIAQGNSDLSGRTEQQASSLQQTSASMEELGTTVAQNAESARQADALARNASQVAAKGGSVVSQVVDTMRGINESSKRIADIIGVIDGIAFQTNILALNAAVEAARAGEQGRGFAVVASEVRNLAQRSAQAAKEIKALISASVERVHMGTQQVDQAGATMAEVVSAVNRMTDIMGSISAASEQQSSGVRQVGEAVNQMDRTTQQNASLVEQSAAAAESLRRQARELVEAVAVFRVAKTAH